MSNLGSGETKFVVPPGAPSAPKGDSGCGGCLTLIVLCLLSAVFSNHNDGPSYSSSPSMYYGGLPLTTEGLTPPAAPRPQFAAFTQTRRNQHGSPQAFIF